MKDIFSKFSEFISHVFGSTKSENHHEKSEYEKVWDEINSSYERAKKRNKIIDFYLGKGDYFHRNDDFGDHDVSVSFFGLIEYSKKNGNEKMLISFKNDIEKILKTELTSLELLHIMTYIWIYLYKFYEEKTFNVEWTVEKSIRQLIKKQVEKFYVIYPKGSNHEYFSDGFLFEAVISKIKNIKNRTGIDLLDETGNSDVTHKN